jgi:WD40 repeat protein
MAMNRLRLLTAFLVLFIGGDPARAQQKQAEVATKPPSVKCLAFSPDGKWLAVAYSESNSVVIWGVASHQRKFAVKEKSSISSVAYSPKGDSLAVGTANVVKLLDPETGDVRRELTGHKSNVRSVAFTPDGKQLASGSNDRTVNIWNVSTGEVQRTIADFRGGVGSVSISSDGKWLATACGDKDAVKLWNLEMPKQSPQTIGTGGSFVQQSVFSPDSHFLAYPSSDGNVTCVEVATSKEYFQIRVGGGEMAWSPDGRWLGVASGRKAIDLLEMNRSAGESQRGQIAALIERFDDDDYATRETAGQQLAALGIAALPQLRANLESSSPEVRIRCRRLVERLQRAEFAVKLVGHDVSPNCVAFSPDSKLLASGDWRGTVKLWDVAEAKELASLEPD